MNLLDHAKRELEMSGAFDKDSDYDGAIGKAVLELIEVFSKQEHSGYSAGIVRTIFNKLANYEPLMDITGKDEEWVEVTYDENRKLYQNKRCSSLFKDEENGRAYNIDAIIKRDQKGITWSGYAWLSEDDYKSGDRNKMIGKKGYIKSFPFKPKTFVIDVKDIEVEKDDWESFIIDTSQLDKVKEYYDIF